MPPRAKPRPSQRASCEGKFRHLAKADAERHLVHLLIKDGGRGRKMKVYRCGYCAAWHVGHKS